MRALTLFALFASSASIAAVPMPDCVKPGPEGAVPTLDAVRTCQERERKRIFAQHAKGDSVPPWLAEKLDDHQRAEVRDFLAKHPEQASFSHAEAKSEKAQKADILALLKAYFDGATAKIGALLDGKSTTSNAPADLEAARSLKTVLDAAKESGLDLEKHKTGSLLNPGATLQKRAGEYNKSLKTNLDPSMKKFYKGGKSP